MIKIMLLLVWTSQAYGQSEDLQPTCSATLIIDGTPNINIIPGDNYEVSDWISATNAVATPGDNVTFDAGNFIILNPTFQANPFNGFAFEAIIDGCIRKLDVSNQNEIALQNYPNPFTEQTTIEFTLTKDAPVTLLVFDSMGRQIATLLDAESTTEGTHQVTFEGTDYSSGVYYYTIQAGEFFGTQKMTLIK